MLKKIIIATLLIIALPIKVYASEPELIKGSATAYCVTGTTASGKQTREGICAGSKDWIGKTIFVYQRYQDDSMGDLIGIYESLDTGGTKGLNNGTVVDVWHPDLDACQSFMDKVYEDGCQGYVYILVVESEG